MKELCPICEESLLVYYEKEEAWFCENCGYSISNKKTKSEYIR